MEQLEEFIALSRKRLEAILVRLQMTEEDVSPKPQISSQLGNKDEPPLPPSWPAEHQVSITEEALRNLLGDPLVQLPKRFSDLLVNFTCDQRLLLYEYVTTSSGKCSEPEAPMPLLHEGQLPFAEIVAQKNLEKKKKRRYRKSRPTQIEEVRALVDLQMQALQQYWQGEESPPERMHDKRRRSTSCSRSRNERLGKFSGNERKFTQHERSIKYHDRSPSPRYRDQLPRSHKDEKYRERSPRRDLHHPSRRKRSRSRTRRVSRSSSPSKRRRDNPSPRHSGASSRQRRHSSSPERKRHKKSKHKSKSKHKKRSRSRSSHKSHK